MEELQEGAAPESPNVPEGGGALNVAPGEAGGGVVGLGGSPNIPAAGRGLQILDLHFDAPMERPTEYIVLSDEDEPVQLPIGGNIPAAADPAEGEEIPLPEEVCTLFDVPDPECLTRMAASSSVFSGWGSLRSWKMTISDVCLVMTCVDDHDRFCEGPLVKAGCPLE